MKKYLKNKYLVTLVLFALWMVFFDQNNFFAQHKISKELNQLEARKKMYTHQNSLLELQKNNLLGSVENLEKLAREKYLMKKDDETVFLIEEE